jgi:hypothetical protein
MKWRLNSFIYGDSNVICGPVELLPGIIGATLFETATTEKNFMRHFIQAALLADEVYLLDNLGMIFTMDHAEQVVTPLWQAPWSLVA